MITKIIPKNISEYNAFCKLLAASGRGELTYDIDNAVRFSYNSAMKALNLSKAKGEWTCVAGILCNVLLSAAKIAVGWIFGFVSVLADGFNNLSDMGSGVVALASLRIAQKPADRQHPYGHRRAEYIASMITGLIVLLLAAELVRGSIESIVKGSDVEGTSWVVYTILAASVAVKLAMFVAYGIGAKRLDSDVLKSAEMDSLCDSLATAAVIVGAALSPIAPFADGAAGMIVSLFIVWQGIRILRDAASKLLGQAPDDSLTERIRDTALGCDKIIGIHDLQIYSYGKGVYFATLHAEMDASLPMLSAHAAVDEIENTVRRETGVVLTIHIDPVDLTNCEESSLKLKLWEEVRNITDGIELHDFRLMANEVEFDVCVPYSCKFSDEWLTEEILAIVKQMGDYDCTMRIERK